MPETAPLTPQLKVITTEQNPKGTTAVRSAPLPSPRSF